MFDISFTELALCFVVALVVLGPERLPGVARMFGRWTGQARAYLRNLTVELERETQVSEIRRQIQETQREVDEAGNSIRKTTDDLGRDLRVDDKTPPP